MRRRDVCYTNKIIDVSFIMLLRTTTLIFFNQKQCHFIPATKSITFTKDSMTQTIEVPIYDDSYKESDETFWLTPVSTSGYNGAKDITFKNAGEGTIIDNDTNGQVVIEVSSTSADEGDSGTQSASVTISISQALQDDLFVNMSDGNSYKIVAGSNDYTFSHNDKIKSKNITQEPLNNICILNTFTFIKKTRYNN